MATANWYGLSLQGQYSATAARRIDWVGDTIKLALVTTTGTPNQDTFDFWDDQQTNEVAITGYTAGGATLGTKSTSYDTATNETRLIAADVSWTLTGAFRYGIIYKDTGTASTSPLMGYIDYGAQTLTAALFTSDFDQTLGVLKITAA